MLEKAIEVAVVSHADQTDRNGEAYILHPWRRRLNPPRCLRLGSCRRSRRRTATVIRPTRAALTWQPEVAFVRALATTTVLAGEAMDQTLLKGR
jgi:hypothetical protein